MLQERGAVDSPSRHVRGSAAPRHQEGPLEVVWPITARGESNKHVRHRISFVTALGVVRATMILATIAWAIGEVAMRRSAVHDRVARAIWTMGVTLALIHVVLAFRFVYEWHHEAAVAATVRQAADRFGLGWRGGIYVNYVFLALWLADVCWWWVAAASHASRPLWIERVRLAFFTFMFVNGAIVFASGIGRVVGIAAVTLVVVSATRIQPAALRDSRGR